MNQEKIGKFISISRKKQNLTQEELAEKLGVSNRSVSRWECGKNLPDVSLYEPLCEILDVSINDLISGELISKEQYEKTAELNVMNVIKKVDSLQKKKRILIGVIVLLTLLIIAFLLYLKLPSEIGDTLRYDNRVIKCNFENYYFIYEIKGISVVRTDYIEKDYNGEKLFFFTSDIPLINKVHSHWETWESMAELLEGRKPKYASLYQFEINNNTKTKVYYTEMSLNKIKKANNNELTKIIKKSNLMCQN